METKPIVVSKIAMKKRGSRIDQDGDTRRYWRLKIQEDDPDTGRRKKPRYETVGWVTKPRAEEIRVEREAELRLGIVGRSDSGSWSTSELLGWFVVQIGLGATSDAHRERTAQDAANVARHLGRVAADRLRDEHVRRYVSKRSSERVVRIRRRRGEPDEAWRSRVRAARADPDGKPISSTTILNELRTLRMAMTMAYESGQLASRPIRLPKPKSLPKDHRTARKLTDAEVRALLGAAEESERARPESLAGLADLVEVLAFSGRRPVAVFGLRRATCLEAASSPGGPAWRQVSTGARTRAARGAGGVQ